MAGSLTGGVRFRSGWFGRPIVEVEYSSMWRSNYTRGVEPTLHWKDATMADLQSLSGTFKLIPRIETDDRE